MAKNSSHKPAKAGPLANLPIPFLAAGICAVVIVVIGLLVSGNRPQPQPEVAQSVPAESPKPSAVVQQPSEPPVNVNVEPAVENPAAAAPAELPVTPPAINNDTPESPAPVATITPPAPIPAAPIDPPATPTTPSPPTQPAEVPEPTAVASSTPTPPPAVPQATGGSTPTPGLPDEQALNAARAQVLLMFGADARAASNPDLKSKLAAKMMKLAEENSSDPAIRYVLYDNARKLYIGAGEGRSACQAAQDLSHAFRMKLPAHYDLIFATYTALSDAKLTDQQREQLQDMLGTSVSVHLREKEAKEADQVSLLRMKVVAKLNDPQLKKAASQQRAEALQLKAESSPTSVKVVRPEVKKKQRDVVQSFDAVQMATATDLTSKGGKLVCGWEFKTNAEMRITQLGLFSKQPEGLFTPHPVAIWDLENRQPIAFTTIPAGDRAVADGLFRFVPINPVLLQANRHYAIVAYFGDDVDKTVSMMNPQQGPIEFSGHFEVIGNRRAYPRDKMAFPDQSDLGVKRATIGPTFRYEALELKKLLP